MTIKPIPAGYQGVTPYLSINGAADAIEFYKQAFGATELFRMPESNGEIRHAEIKIGSFPVMMSDGRGAVGVFRNPQVLTGTSICLHLYVEDVDVLFAQAIEAGAKVVKPVQNQFYGDRIGILEDPFGYVWCIATHKEDLAPEVIRQRAEALYKS